jgi:hypothetical protein
MMTLIALMRGGVMLVNRREDHGQTCRQQGHDRSNKELEKKLKDETFIGRAIQYLLLMISSTRGVNKQEKQTWELVSESMIDDDVGLRLVANKGKTIDGDVSLA